MRLKPPEANRAVQQSGRGPGNHIAGRTRTRLRRDNCRRSRHFFDSHRPKRYSTSSLRRKATSLAGSGPNSALLPVVLRCPTHGQLGWVLWPEWRAMLSALSRNCNMRSIAQARLSNSPTCGKMHSSIASVSECTCAFLGLALYVKRADSLGIWPSPPGYWDGINDFCGEYRCSPSRGEA